MKKTKKILGIVALVAIIGFTMSGCVTTAIGGTSDPHGLLGGGAAKAAVTEGAQEIASYTIILNLIESGYAEYAAAVKSAEAAGKKITSVVTAYGTFFQSITAYAR